MMTAIKDSSGDVLNAEEGSLYPALHRMEEAGWVRAEWMTKERGRRMRMYQLTAAGKKQLAEEETRWQAASAASGHVLDRHSVLPNSNLANPSKCAELPLNIRPAPAIS
jgi:PadR family transcriptional regulator PadR